MGQIKFDSFGRCLMQTKICEEHFACARRREKERKEEKLTSLYPAAGGQKHHLK